jgi:hypothetical protein
VSAGFTLGRWVANDQHSGSNPWRIETEEGVLNDGWIIADLLGPDAEANARLIEAAPDLLEALELADATLRGANMNRNAVERKVSAALTKARGEA